LVKRKFIDLHVKSTLSVGKSSPSQIAKMASYLGYKAVGLADFNTSNLNLLNDIKELFKSYNIDLISRVDLEVESPRKLKSILRRIRRKVEVISVYCKNLSIARLAARDRRVDILNFSVKDWRRNFFDKSEALLAINGESALEVNLIDLIKVKSPGERIQAIRILRDNIKVAKRYGVPIIISSGATSIFEMRAPRELAALATILGLTEFEARESLSNIPMNLVNKNREKLSESFIMPGVKIIKKGDHHGEGEKK